MSVDHRTPPPAGTDATTWAARSLVWRDGHVVATDVDSTELIELLARDEATQAWWCLPRAEGPGLTAAADFLGLDSLAVDDILGAHESPKLDTVGDTVMIIGGGVRFDPEGATLDIDRVSILATKRARCSLRTSIHWQRWNPCCISAPRG